MSMTTLKGNPAITIVLLPQDLHEGSRELHLIQKGCCPRHDNIPRHSVSFICGAMNMEGTWPTSARD